MTPWDKAAIAIGALAWVAVIAMLVWAVWTELKEARGR